MANDLKSRIEQRLSELGISARSASLSVGDKPDLIRTVLRGYSKNPRADSIKKIAEALGVSELWLLHGDEAPDSLQGEVRRAHITLPTKDTMPKDIPVFGTAAGATAGSFQLEDNVVDWVRRPPSLEGAKDIYAIYVQGDSMAPEHRPGDLRIVNPHRPPAIGDTVIIQVKDDEHAEIAAYIKILAGRKNGMIILEQHNPETTIEFDQRIVIAIHRVLPLAELFGV